MKKVKIKNIKSIINNIIKALEAVADPERKKYAGEIICLLCYKSMDNGNKL